MRIEIKNLNDQIFFQKLSKQIDEIEFYNLVSDAMNILRELDKALKSNRGNLEKNIEEKYNVLIVKLKFILLINLSELEILSLFKNYVYIGLSMAYVDLAQLLRTRISLIIVDDRDVFKNKILKNILSCDKNISKIKIDIAGGKEKSTISNWLKNYISYIGTNKLNVLKHNEFFIKNKNILLLDDNEKNKIKRLLDIYWYLKSSSYTLEGNEDDETVQDIDGNTIMFYKGNAFKIIDKKISGIINEVKDEISNQKNKKHYEKMPEKTAKVKSSEPIEIKTLKQEKEIKTGDMLFDKSDDKEIEKLKAKNEELKNSENTQAIDLNLETEQIIKKLDLRLNSFLTARFKNIIISSLKGIRDKIGLKEVLSRSIENGGMGMDEKIIDQILAEIQNQKKKIKDKPIRIMNQELRIKEKKLENKKDDKIEMLPKEEKDDLLAEHKKNSLLKSGKIKAIAPPPPVRISDIGGRKSEVGGRRSEVKNKEEKIVGEKNIQNKKEEKKLGFFGKLFGKKRENVNKNRRDNKAITGNNEIVALTGDHPLGVASSAIASSQRQAGDRVKSEIKNRELRINNQEEKKRDDLENEKPKLVGPIEELENLSIDDFRSWSDDPIKAIEKIEEKINVAGEKFFEKRALGIKAWKKSEINRMYLDILNNCLIKHKQIEEIIEEKKKERKAVLNKDEFEAIMELNKRLRF